jgi:hypothetical protein
MPVNHTSQYAELTDEQFGIIGRLVVEWSNIEVLLGVLLSRLLFMPDFLGRVYSDEISASKLQSALEKAIEIHKYRYNFRVVSADTIDEIAKLKAEIEKSRIMRNKFAHFCWCRSNDDEICGAGFSGIVSPKKRLDKDFIKLSVGELRDAYKSAYDLVDQMSDVIRKLPETDEEENLSPSE